MFGAWDAHQKPSTAAKLPPGSKILGVVQPLSCISKGDSHNKLQILEGAGQKQGVTGLRLHWDHTQVQQVQGQNNPFSSTAGWEVPLPLPSQATLGPALQGSKGTGWTLDATGT